jgi:hypothetical protein
MSVPVVLRIVAGLASSTHQADQCRERFTDQYSERFTENTSQVNVVAAKPHYGCAKRMSTQWKT